MLRIDPVSVTFGFVNSTSNGNVLTGDPVVFMISAATRMLSLSFNVDFGDGSAAIYSLIDANQTISRAYAFAGVYNVTMTTVDGAYINIIPIYSLKVNVTGRPSCSPPLLSIENKGSFDNPMLSQRSSTLTLTSVTILSCSFDNTNTKIWTLNEVDPMSGALIGSPIDLTQNASRFAGSNQGILVVYANSLEYGRYLFKYTVTVRYTMDGGLTYLTLQTDISTYVQIMPTGLNVFGLPKGILQQTYGLNQQILLDAGSNTKDLDLFIDPKTLYYQFFCQVIPNGYATTYYTNQYSVVTQYGTTNYFQVKNTTTALNTPSTECLESKITISYKLFIFQFNIK
jgi:hypothetical protein